MSRIGAPLHPENVEGDAVAHLTEAGRAAQFRDRKATVDNSQEQRDAAAAEARAEQLARQALWSLGLGLGGCALECISTLYSGIFYHFVKDRTEPYAPALFCIPLVGYALAMSAAVTALVLYYRGTGTRENQINRPLAILGGTLCAMCTVTTPLFIVVFFLVFLLGVL